MIRGGEGDRPEQEDPAQAEQVAEPPAEDHERGQRHAFPLVIGSPRARLTLVAMTLAGSMILVDQASVPLAIPRVVGGLDASPRLSQWVLTANVHRRPGRSPTELAGDADAAAMPALIYPGPS